MEKPIIRLGLSDCIMISDFLYDFDINDSKEIWWDKIQTHAQNLGSAKDLAKEFANAIRVGLSGRTNTPDLYQIIQVMGDDRVRQRLQPLADLWIASFSDDDKPISINKPNIFGVDVEFKCSITPLFVIYTPKEY